MDVFDALVFGMASARTPKISPDRVVTWPTWGVVTLASVLWACIGVPLIFVVLIAPGPMRPVLLATLGPAIVAYTGALAAAITVATHTVERESGHRLAGILMNASFMLTGLGLGALMLIGAWVFMHAMFNSG